MSLRSRTGPAGRSSEIDFIRERVEAIRTRVAEWLLAALLAACAAASAAMLATVIGRPVPGAYRKPQSTQSSQILPEVCEICVRLWNLW